MKKKIMFAGEEREFEANLGTSDLYEMLTGNNLFVQLSAYKGINAKDAQGVEALRYAGVVEIYKRLAYVMNVQAEAPDIPTMRGKMNMDDYLTWTFKYTIDDFSKEFTNEIAALWRANTKTHSISKNQ